MTASNESGLRGLFMSRTGLILIGLLGIAGYFLWTEHQAHIIAAVPWLLLGGCVLMHLFMHGGHGGGGLDRTGGEDSDTRDS